MKLLLFLAISIPFIAQIYAQGVPGAVEAEMGANHRLWKLPPRNIESRPNLAEEGLSPSERRRHVVEIETGMNYWDGNGWSSSEPSFEDGGGFYVANRIQHKVKISSKLNRQGAVSLTTPDGIELRSTPVAIMLYDAETGKHVMVSTLTNSSALMIDTNRIMFLNAFSGVQASVVYTIGRASFDQDVIITGNLNPADYGLSPKTSRIQVFTEFYDAPEPERIRRPLRVEKDEKVRNQMISPDLIDDSLTFGQLLFGIGKCYKSFPKLEEGVAAAVVAKEFTTIDGRTFLIESVEYTSIFGKAPELEASSRSRTGTAVAYSSISSIPLIQRPEEKEQLIAAKKVARQAIPEGIVIDYRAEITQALSVYTADATYLVTGPVIHNSACKIEAGAVFKFNPMTSTIKPSLKFNSTLALLTSMFRPAVFTSVNDDTIGESMAGLPNAQYTSTTDPLSVHPFGYADPAIWLYFTSGTLNNVKILFAREAIRIEGAGMTGTINNSQLVKCIRGIVLVASGSGSGSGGTITVNNSLFSSVSNPIMFETPSGQAYVYNSTVHNIPAGGYLVNAPPGVGYSGSAQFVNSIFANIGVNTLGSVTLSGSYNAFSVATSFGGNIVASPTPPFQTAGAGNYYLTAQSPLRNAGTPTIAAPLLRDLRQRTTYPPLTQPSTITADTTLQQVQRDIDGVDLGYHYEPLDYLINTLEVASTVRLIPGTAVGTFGNSGFVLKDGSKFLSEGTPLNRNHVVRYNNVQEQPVILSSGSVSTYKNINPIHGGVTLPIIDCRFTDFDASSGGGYHLYSGTGGSTVRMLKLRDSSFLSGKTLFSAASDAPYNANDPNFIHRRSIITLNNNLFERVDVQFQGYPELLCYNSLFKGSGTAGAQVTFTKSSGPNTWIVKDNTFDSVAITTSGTLMTFNHNAYVNGTTGGPIQANQPAVTSLTYSAPSSGLGTYYYSGTSSPTLKNAGSREAQFAGVYFQTATSDLIADGASVVDVGYHYGRTCGWADSVWVQDALPAGGAQVIDPSGTWTWVTGGSPTPFSGGKSLHSPNMAGMHQLYFTGASFPLVVNTGERLFAYVYLVPNSGVQEIMLQWFNGNWNHRAFWGADSIPWGVNGTDSRRYMGPLPPEGKWVRLEVPAHHVGLTGSSITGMAFTLYGGQAIWDNAGKMTANPCYDSDHDSIPDYSEGPVVTAPIGLYYQEDQGPKAIFLDANPALSAGATHPDSANYAGGALNVYFAEGGFEQDELYLYLAGNEPGGAGGSYAAFSNEGNDLLLNGDHVATVQGVTISGKPTLVKVGSGSSPLSGFQVVFTAAANISTIDGLLKNINYYNGDQNPQISPRIISVLSSDGEGGLSVPTVTKLDIASINDPPAAYNLTFYSSGSSVNVKLEGRDIETTNSDMLTYAVTSQPTYGSVAPVSGRNVIYTPPSPGPNVSSVGVATFNYTVSDGGATAVGTVTIYVGGGGNPLVNAGPDQTISLYSSCGLAGSPNPLPVNRRFSWSTISGPMPAVIAPVDILTPPAYSVLFRASNFGVPGVYVLRLTLWDTKGTSAIGDDTVIGTDDVNITVRDYSPPVADAGPDRLLAANSPVTINGSAIYDGAPVPSTALAWYQLSGPSVNFSTSAGNLILPALPIGTYHFRLAANYGGFDTDEVMIRVVASDVLKGWTWTRNVDFESGFLQEVTYDEISDALTISTERRRLPFIDGLVAVGPHVDIPHFVRFDAASGAIVGAYMTEPRVPDQFSSQGTFGKLVVDPSGDTWHIGGYNVYYDVNQAAIPYIFAQRYGIVLGGTRGRRVGSAPPYSFVDDPNGEYLRPPYKYNTCIDRDGDGYLRVSGSKGQILDWVHPLPKSTTYTAQQILAQAQDETLKELVLIGSSTFSLEFPHLAGLDTAMNLWWSAYDANEQGIYQRYDTVSKSLHAPIQIASLNCNFTWGEGVIDRNNQLWLRPETGLLQINLPGVPPGNETCLSGAPTPSWGSRSLSVDYSTGDLWLIDGTTLYKRNSSGTFTTVPHGLSLSQQSLKEIVADGLGNIWVMDTYNQISRVRTDGLHIGTITVDCFVAVNAMGLDADGRLWVSGTRINSPDNYPNGIVRIDPAKGPVGGGGLRVGAIDLERAVNIDNPQSAQQATVTAFASSETARIIPEKGEWRIIHDAGSNPIWGTLQWKAWEDTVAGALISIEARAAATQEALMSSSAPAFVPIGNITTTATGAKQGTFSGTGRFVEVRVSFKKGTGGVRPILYDLTLVPAAADPTAVEIIPQVAFDDEITVFKNSKPVTIPVLANDTVAGLSIPVNGVTAARRGSVSVANNQILYAPATEFFGDDRFVYTVEGLAGSGIKDRAVVKVKVLPTEAAPVANGLHGTLVADTGGTLPEWVSGEVRFAGTGKNRVTVADDEPLDLAGSLTISFRMTPDEPTVTRTARIIGKGTASAENYAVWFVSGASPRLEFRYGSVTVPRNISFAGNTSPHVAVTLADGQVRFYIDGILESTTTVSGVPTANTHPLTIGSSGFNNAGFAGTLDEVHIYNRALSLSEITALQSSSFWGTVSSASSMVARYSMNQVIDEDPTNDNTVIDSSGTPIASADGTYNEWRERFGEVDLLVDCEPAAPANPPVAAQDIVVTRGRVLPTDTGAEVAINVLNNDRSVNPFVLVDDFPRKTVFGNVRRAGNVLYYLPGVNSYGVDRFSYTIRDSLGVETTGNVIVYVAPIEPPTIELLLPNETPVSQTLGSPLTLPLQARVTPGLVNTSAFNNDFFYGLATGQLFPDPSAAQPTVRPKILTVEFFDGDRRAAFMTSRTSVDGQQVETWETQWQNVPAGTRVITAVATDALGVQVMSQAKVKIVNRAAGASQNGSIIAAISGFGIGDIASDSELGDPPATGADPAGVASSRPKFVTKGRPEMYIWAADSDNLGVSSANIFYQLLLFRSDGSLVANITSVPANPQIAGYAPLARTSMSAPPNLPVSIGRVDLTAFQNGGYELELRVSDGIDEALSTRFPFVLRTGLKMGQFTFSEEDTVMNTIGLPLAVVRTYDSSNPWDGDFGHGWSFAINDLNVEFNDDRITATDLETDELFSVRVGGGRDVTLTLPDGRRTTFAYRIKADVPENPWAYRAYWAAEPGIAATLTTLEPGKADDLGDNTMFAPMEEFNFWTRSGPACPIVHYDLPGFILKLQDGTEYTIEREELGDFATEISPGRIVQVSPRGKARVTRIKRPNNEILAISNGAIEHYLPSGEKTRSLYFERGAGNRIVAIRDGANQSESVAPLVRYEYDGRGNLVYVHKLVERTTSQQVKYATTTYAYEKPEFPHYITKVIDARGVPLARNTYYADGKLQKMTDPEERETTFLYDYVGPFTTASRGAVARQTISDHELRETKHETDARGNVLLSIDAKNVHTERWFDDRNNLITQVIKPSYAAGGIPERHSLTYHPTDAARITSRISGGRIVLSGGTDTATASSFYNPAGANNALKFVANEVGSHYNVIAIDFMTADSEISGNTADVAFDTSGAVLIVKYDSVTTTASTIASAVTSATAGTFTPITASLDSTTSPGDSPNSGAGNLGSIASTREEFNARGQLQFTIDARHYQPLQALDLNLIPFYNEMEYDAATGFPLKTWAKGSQFTTTLLSENSYYTASDPAPSDKLAGLPKETYDALGNRTRHLYYTVSGADGRFGDLKDSIQEQKNANGTFTILAWTSYKYDPVTGNRKAEIRRKKDQNGTWQDYATTTFEYDAGGRQIKTTDAVGGVSSTVYNSSSQALSSTDRYGATTRYIYDKMGRRVQTEYPDKTITRNATYYDSVTKLRHEIIEDRHSPSDPVSAITGSRTIYDELGRPARSERLKDLNITFVLNNGELGQATFVAAQVVSFTEKKYDYAGRVDLASDANAKWTKYEYDEAGRLWRTRSFVTSLGADTADTIVAIQDYDKNGNTAWTLDPNQHALIQASIPASSASAAKQWIAANHIGRLTSFQYDQFNRVTKTILPDDATVNNNTDNPFTESKYDIAGRKWLEMEASLSSDPNRKGTAFFHDALGRLSWVVTDVTSSVTLPSSLHTTISAWETWARGARSASDSTATQYTYDDLGNLKSQIDALGRTTSYDYDKLGRRTLRTMPAGATSEEWVHDFNQATGLPAPGPVMPNAVRQKDFNGQFVINIQDLSGRPIERKENGVSRVTYAYSPTGQRSRMVDNIGTAEQRTTDYAYDESGRLKVKKSPQGTLSYAYDNAGNVTQISARHSYTFPIDRPWLFITSAQVLNSRSAGAHMSYQYDNRNRLWKVFGDPSQTILRATYTHDKAGNLGTLAYGNNVTSSHIYNFRHQLRFLSVSGASSTITFDYDDYDTGDGITWPATRRLAPSGLRRGVRENLGVAGYPRLVGYNYDGLNRLTKEELYSGAWLTVSGYVQYDSAAGYADTLGYDKVGNRRQRNVLNFNGVIPRTYAPYDANDRPGNNANPVPSQVSVRFDANGNTLQFDLDATGAAWDQASTDTYDFGNRLVGAVRAAGSLACVYDGDGHRVKKVVNATVTHFLVDDRNPTGYAQVLEEQSFAGGTPSAKYAYGLDLIHQDRGGTIHYFGYDGHGNVRYLTTSAATVSDTYTYDAFGIQTATTASGTATVNSYRYSGEQWDEHLGMYYLRARYDHPDLGRFWTSDSFEGNQTDPLSLHKYLYAHADPVNNTDPSGLENLPSQGVTAAGVGGLAATANSAISQVTARVLFQLTRAYLNADKIIFAFEAGTTALGAGAIIANGALHLSATAFEAVADMTDNVVHSYANNTRQIPAGWSSRGFALERIGAQHLGQAYVGGNVNIIDVFEGNGTKVVASFKSHSLDPSLPDLEGRYIAAFTKDAEAVSEAGRRPISGTRADGRPFTLAPGAVDAKVVYAPIPENHSRVLLSSRVTQGLRDVAQRTRTFIVPIPTRNWKR